MTRKERRAHQQFYGALSILLSILATMCFFGGALVHDFGGFEFEKARNLIMLLWFGSAAFIFGSIGCLIIGIDTD